MLCQSSKRFSLSSTPDKAHILLAQSEIGLAIKFLTRALSLEPKHLEARELLGIAELEGGDPNAGRLVCPLARISGWSD